MMTHFHCGCFTRVLTSVSVHTQFNLAFAIVTVILWYNIGNAMQCSRTPFCIGQVIGAAPKFGLLSMQLQRKSGGHNLVDLILISFSHCRNMVIK